MARPGRKKCPIGHFDRYLPRRATRRANVRFGAVPAGEQRGGAVGLGGTARLIVRP
jgi:hypothetical protein